MRRANPFFHTWVSGTDRATEEVALHGSSAWGVFVRRANPFFRTWGVLRLNTDYAEGVALVSVGFAWGVSSLFSARGVQIGTGQACFSTGRAISLLLR